MNQQEKLRVLIPHWIEHNNEHAREFFRWAESAGPAATDILAAADALTRANEALASGLKKLGGRLGDHSHHHD